MSTTATFKIVWQYCLPQHLLSRLVGWFADTKIPWIRNALIKAAMKHFGIELTESEIRDPQAFSSFNAFFTRALQPGARPIASESHAIVSPADGTISQLGLILENQILQAKGHYYTLDALLGSGNKMARQFMDGRFLTTYLAPKDYHRVHVPLSGQLLRMIYVPGRLFSVNPLTTATVKGLFARNERVICEFKTIVGPMAIIMVGAMLVASIKTPWAGIVAPRRDNIIKTWDYTEDAIHFEKGQEIGQFSFGSTVIVLFPKDTIAFKETLKANETIRMGQIIGVHS